MDLSFLARAAPGALAHYSMAKQAGETQRRQDERQHALDTFAEYAKRRQMATDEAQLAQQGELTRAQLAQALAIRQAEANRMREMQTERLQATGEQANQRYADQLSLQKFLEEGRNERAAADRNMRGAIASTSRGAANDQRSIANEQRLTKQFSSEPAVKNATEIGSRLAQMQAAGEGPAGDLSLIFGYMKILDPTSVVREGEQASAANARGVPETIRNLHNRILRGDKLTPTQRQSFQAEALNLAKAQNKTLDQIKNRYGKLSSRAGADSATVVGDPYAGLLDNPPAASPSVPPRRSMKDIIQGIK